MKIGPYLVGAARMPKYFTTGLSNCLGDDRYVLFVDYDGTEYEIVLRDLRHLHEVYGLCIFAVFESSKYKQPLADMEGKGDVGNWQVIGLCKGGWHDVIEWLGHCRCDRKFAAIGERHSRRAWVLRFGSKKRISDGKDFKLETKFREWVCFDEGCARQHSSGMAKFIDLNWGADLQRKYEKGVEWDKLLDVEMVSYGCHK